MAFARVLPSLNLSKTIFVGSLMGNSSFCEIFDYNFVRYLITILAIVFITRARCIAALRIVQLPHTHKLVFSLLSAEKNHSVLINKKVNKCDLSLIE